MKAQEYNECTYYPQMESNKTFKRAEVPKLYYETVKRLRKGVLKKNQNKVAEENAYSELNKRYQKLKHKPFNPPSFLKTRPKKNIMIYVNINIRPGK